MEFLAQYGMFLLKASTIVIAVVTVLISIVAIFSKGKLKNKEHLSVKKLNTKYDDLRNQLQEILLDKKQLKQFHKAEKQKQKKSDDQPRSRVFVIDFIGDMKASSTANLREEVTAILTIATPQDEVLVRLESPGGVVHGYGLAASQLQRFREHNIPLTIAVDKVAASGGYMMACVANQIIAAPFAIIGSIGVVLQMPNFNKWLKKHDIDYEQLTSGEYKRTLTLFGENDEKGRKKMQEDLNDTHTLFKEFISEHRHCVDLNKVGTGEYWFGTRAKELQLVDYLQTSDEYLITAAKKSDIYHIEYIIKKPLGKRLAQSAKQSLMEFTAII